MVEWSVEVEILRGDAALSPLAHNRFVKAIFKYKYLVN